MNDRLKQLIEQADLAPSDAAVSARDFAARVRGMHGHRRRRSLVAALAVSALATGTLLWNGLPHAHGLQEGVKDGVRAIAAEQPMGKHEQNPAGAKTENVSRPSIDDERALDEARQRIERSEYVVAKLLLAERRRQLAALPAAADYGLDRQSRYEDQIGPAAAALLMTGDERAKRPDHSAAAREDYACVIENFPNTIWAARAAERLAALQH